MAAKLEKLAEKLLNRDWEKLGERERKVLESIENRSSVARNTNRDVEDTRTFGERTADKIAKFGGSWTFMFCFAGILCFWVILNSYVLANRNETFDPYPYIGVEVVLEQKATLRV